MLANVAKLYTSDVVELEWGIHGEQVFAMLFKESFDIGLHVAAVAIVDLLPFVSYVLVDFFRRHGVRPYLLFVGTYQFSFDTVNGLRRFSGSRSFSRSIPKFRITDALLELGLLLALYPSHFSGKFTCAC